MMQVEPITRAMILAAGKGTRMRPAPDDVPKPLIEINGQALLGRMIMRLAEAGIRRVVVNVHHKADRVENYLAAHDWPIEIVVSDERETLLETGGGVKKALPLLAADKFLVCNADIVWRENQPAIAGQSIIDKLMGCYQAGNVHLLLAAPNATTGYDGSGDFALVPQSAKGGHGFVRRLQNNIQNGQNENAYVFAGVQILTRDWVNKIADNFFSLNKIYDAALASNHLTGYVMDGLWMHVGTKA
ncbi:MAG: nucleotidyltransferase family protein, partial [Parvibaculales bacterium]